MPYRLHPLWYSPLLPLLFLVSAIAPGDDDGDLRKPFHRVPVPPQAGDRGCWPRSAERRAGCWLLYLAIRFGDLAVRGQLGHLAAADWRVAMFWFEIAAMAIVPADSVLHSARRAQRGAASGRRRGVGVFGVVLNRIDVGGLVHLGSRSALYLPAWTEVAISAGVVSAAALAFLFMMERFQVWEQRPADPEADPLKLPEFDKVGATWLGVPAVAGTHRVLAGLCFRGIGRVRVARASARGRPRHRSAAGPPGAGWRHSLDRRQSGRLWRRLPP